jgi:hypothetical protein
VVTPQQTLGTGTSVHHYNQYLEQNAAELATTDQARTLVSDFDQLTPQQQRVIISDIKQGRIVR